MQQQSTFSGRPARYCLSPRGDSTAADYRLRVSAALRARSGTTSNAELHEWAESHGLEPHDGVYLAELAAGAPTLNDVGEALAVFGQTRERIGKTLERLVSRGFASRLPSGARRLSGPTLDTAKTELATAESELEEVRRELEANFFGDRHVITPRLRGALSRVVVARRFIGTLSRVA